MRLHPREVPGLRPSAGLEVRKRLTKVILERGRNDTVPASMNGEARKGRRRRRIDRIKKVCEIDEKPATPSTHESARPGRLEHSGERSRTQADTVGRRQKTQKPTAKACGTAAEVTGHEPTLEPEEKRGATAKSGVNPQKVAVRTRAPAAEGRENRQQKSTREPRVGTRERGHGRRSGSRDRQKHVSLPAQAIDESPGDPRGETGIAGVTRVRRTCAVARAIKGHKRETGGAERFGHDERLETRAGKTVEIDNTAAGMPLSVEGPTHPPPLEFEGFRG